MTKCIANYVKNTIIVMALILYNIYPEILSRDPIFTKGQSAKIISFTDEFALHGSAHNRLLIFMQSRAGKFRCTSFSLWFLLNSQCKIWLSFMGSLNSGVKSESRNLVHAVNNMTPLQS